MTVRELRGVPLGLLGYKTYQIFTAFLFSLPPAATSGYLPDPVNPRSTNSYSSPPSSFHPQHPKLGLLIQLCFIQQTPPRVTETRLSVNLSTLPFLLSPLLVTTVV